MASADSSFIASLSASCTNSLIAGSPQALLAHWRVLLAQLTSREQYLRDVGQLGYVEGRLTPASTMTAEDVAAWTESIPARRSQEGQALGRSEPV